METCKLSPALLQPQVTVVASLGELLATLPSLDEILLMSPGCLYMDLEFFTRELRATLYRTDDTLWRHNVTYDDDDPPTSLSKALAIYKDTPWTPRNRVTMVTIMWHLSVSVLVDRWARLARRATKLCRAWRRDATRAATKVRQRVEVALGPLERLVAACDEATAFPRELQRLLGDIEATLERTNEVFPNVPEDLVAEVAMAERLWEANTRLAKDHLLGTIQDIIDFYFGCGRASPGAREVAKRCQRAIEDIPRLLQPLERPQSVPKMSPLSPTLLQPQVTVVAILGELLATLPSQDEMMLLSPKHLDFDVAEFTEELRATLYRFDDTWWCHNVTSNDDDDPITSDDDDPPTSLSQALTTCKSTPGTIRKRVMMAASKWQGLVAALVCRWVKLASKATELRNTCREVATKAAIMVATATARVRELQDEAACDGTAQENMVELGQVLGGEEGAAVVARREAQVRRDAMVAASQATRATMVRQRVEVALGLLERLVAACDEATAFPRELQRLLGDIKPALKGTNDTYPNVPEDLVAKVAMAEQLWEANVRLVKDHLLGTLPDSITFYFDCGPAGPRACEVAERCQRAIEDIPRLLRPLEHPQSVPKLSPVSMELQELSLAWLQPQVSVVAILGEFLDTLPRLDKETLPVSLRCLYWDLEEFTKELQTTLYHIGGTWWNRIVTSDDDGPPATLSQALATYESTPGTTQDHVTTAASKWQGLVALLVNSWAKLARTATKLRNTCRDLATEADDKVATATARARELQVKAALDGTALENMGELGQALGGEEGARVVARPEARVRREACVATSAATRATMVRQRVEVALGLLERLVAACDEATAFPRELQRLLGDIEAALKGTNEVSPNVPEDLVAKVAMAERLCEANARLAQDHLLQTVPDFIEFLFNGCPTGPSAREVAKQCQRAIEDIPRLLQPPERLQSIPKVSPVSKEPQELSSAQLQPQVSVVAILGKLLATLPSQDKMKVVSTVDLYGDLEEFTKDLWATLYRIGGTWRCRDVTVDDDDPATSLSQALTTCKSTPWTIRKHVTMAASKWHTSVSVLMSSWAQLARKATKLRNACKRMVNEAADMVAATTTRARHLQDMVARYWTAQENRVQLGQALGGEEGAKKLDAHETRGREQAMEATSKARRATMVRQRVEVALELLERLVAACDKATVFPRELQRLLRDPEPALKGTNEASPNVPEALVHKVAMAERLWEANARLAKDHLLGAIDDIIKFFFYGDPTSPSACEVAERCQRATKDIARLLRPPECPQSVPKVSPVSMEPQELLEALVSVVATLGEVVATVTRPHRGVQRCVPPKSLHAALGRFTWSLRETLDHGDVTSLGDRGVPSLRQALAALETTPGTTWANVRAVAKAWRELVAKLVDSWDWLAREATKICEKVVMDQQLMVVLDKEEVAREMATHDAQVSAATSEAMGEAVVATRRGHWAEVALGLLQRLVATCDRATLFNWIMEWRLRDIEAILKGTNDVSPDVFQALVAKVAKFKLLWVASTRLAKDHLLGTLGVIDNILLSAYGGHGVLGDPSSCAVAKRCQKAIEDIPRLLGQ